MLFLCKFRKTTEVKRIGILSDTHSYIDDAVFKHFEECDEIWHAGDIGNINVYDELKAFNLFKLFMAI